MPQMTNLVLKDGEDPAVDHTFKPRSIEAGVATLVESTGTPLGESRVTFSQNRTASGRVKAVIKFVLPVTQDAEVNGITRPTVVRTTYVDVMFNFDGGSSTQERTDAVAYLASLLDGDQTMVQAYLVDLEGLY